MVQSWTDSLMQFLGTMDLTSVNFIIRILALLTVVSKVGFVINFGPVVYIGPISGREVARIVNRQCASHLKSFGGGMRE